jgi:prepilin signal peptidase PulO-like enzyme (type II secretory pathway)
VQTPLDILTLKVLCGVALGILAALAIMDFREMRLPDELTEALPFEPFFVPVFLLRG